LVIDHPPYCYGSELSRKAADAALQLLAEPERWSKLARTQATKFDMHQVAQRYLDLLHSV
jgi:hypothetical protein